jgi:ribosome-binding protein aMBF1 (putative translation factor)
VQSEEDVSPVSQQPLQSISEQEMQAIRQRVGQNVRRLREGRGWSRARLAEETNLDVDDITAIEAGEPHRATFDNIDKIIRCLNVASHDLFAGIG